MITNQTEISPEDLARYQARVREAIEGEQRVFSDEDFYNDGPQASDEQLRQKLSDEQLDIPVDALED